MAVTSGVAPHTATISGAGGSFVIEKGTVTQLKKRESSKFAIDIPMDTPGAFAAFSSGLSSEDVTISASGPGGSGELIQALIGEVRMDMISRTIGVAGLDGSAKIHEVKVQKKWINQQTPSIVSELVGQAGLSSAVQALSGLMVGKKVENDYVKLADNVSAGYVIHKLAEFEGANWWVKGKTFHMAKIGATASGGYSINYQAPSPGVPMRSDCMLLIVTYNVNAGKTQTAEIPSYSPPGKKLNKGIHSRGGRLGNRKTTLNIPNLEQDHADQYAKSKVAEIAMHSLQVEATVVGDPSIDIGQGLSLSGTGVFDGTYEIQEIRHVFGYEGYTMDIIAKTDSGSGGGVGGTWGSSTLPADQPGAPAGSATPGTGGIGHA